MSSGKRPSTTGIYGLAPWFRTVPALRGRVTLPQALKAGGYRTLSVGKIYHGGHPPPKDRPAEMDIFGKSPPLALPAKKFVATPDPIKLMEKALLEFNVMNQEKMEAIDEEIREQVDRIYEEAEQSPHPEPQEVYEHVYTDMKPEEGH